MNFINGSFFNVETQYFASSANSRKGRQDMLYQKIPVSF